MQATASGRFLIALNLALSDAYAQLICPYLRLFRALGRCLSHLLREVGEVGLLESKGPQGCRAQKPAEAELAASPSPQVGEVD